MQTSFKTDGNGPESGRLPGLVAVVGENEPGGEPGRLSRLIGRQACSQRGCGVFETGLKEAYEVRVSLDQNEFSGLANGLLAEMETVEMPALGIDGGFG